MTCSCHAHDARTLPAFTGKDFVVPAWLKPVRLSQTDMAALLLRLLATHEPKAVRWVRNLWRSQGAGITAEQVALMLSTGRVPLAVEEAIRRSYAAAVEAGLSKIAASVADGTGRGFFAGMARGAWRLSEPLLAAIAMRGDRLAVDLGREAVQTIAYLAEYFTATEPATTGTFANVLQRFVGLTNREARAVTNMRDALSEAGASAAAIETRTAQYSALLERGRAMRIARTELAFSASKAQQEAIAEARTQGLVTGELAFEWDAQLDTACPICASLHGLRAREGEKFDGGYDWPPVHPNCLCQVITIQLLPRD